jgi:hypothetical protein
MKKYFTMISSLIIFFIAFPISAQQPLPGLDQLRFLLGEWAGEGSGSTPGQGVGTFTFAYDLQNTVIVRRNHADYPATDSKPAYAHDDLMVIYQAAPDTLKAIYFDNEGHVINYNLSVSTDQRTAVFLSEPYPQSPRFRLSYNLSEGDKLSIQFDIAMPGGPDTFSPYIKASAHKK